MSEAIPLLHVAVFAALMFAAGFGAAVACQKLSDRRTRQRSALTILKRI